MTFSLSGSTTKLSKTSSFIVRKLKESVNDILIYYQVVQGCCQKYPHCQVVQDSCQRHPHLLLGSSKESSQTSSLSGGLWKLPKTSLFTVRQFKVAIKQILIYCQLVQGSCQRHPNLCIQFKVSVYFVSLQLIDLQTNFLEHCGKDFLQKLFWLNFTSQCVPYFSFTQQINVKKHFRELLMELLKAKKCIMQTPFNKKKLF